MNLLLQITASRATILVGVLASVSSRTGASGLRQILNPTAATIMRRMSTNHRLIGFNDACPPHEFCGDRRLWVELTLSVPLSVVAGICIRLGDVRGLASSGRRGGWRRGWLAPGDGWRRRWPAAGEITPVRGPAPR